MAIDYKNPFVCYLVREDETVTIWQDDADAGFSFVAFARSGVVEEVDNFNLPDHISSFNNWQSCFSAQPVSIDLRDMKLRITLWVHKTTFAMEAVPIKSRSMRSNAIKSADLEQFIKTNNFPLEAFQHAYPTPFTQWMSIKAINAIAATFIPSLRMGDLPAQGWKIWGRIQGK